MKARPIFNQSFLQRMGSKGNFFIRGRGKNSVSKFSKPQLNSKNSQPEQRGIAHDLQLCLDILDKCQQDFTAFGKWECDQIIAVVSQLSKKVTERPSVFQDIEESASLVFRPSEKREKSRLRMETMANEANMASEIPRGKTPKLKADKENNAKITATVEMKLEKLQKKLYLQDRLEGEYQQKIKNMQEEIDVLKYEKEHLEQEVEKLTLSNKEIGEKASYLVLQKMSSQADLKVEKVELQAKMLEANSKLTCLQERLCQRQQQIVSLFQTHSK